MNIYVGLINTGLISIPVLRFEAPGWLCTTPFMLTASAMWLVAVITLSKTQSREISGQKGSTHLKWEQMQAVWSLDEWPTFLAGLLVDMDQGQAQTFGFLNCICQWIEHKLSYGNNLSARDTIQFLSSFGVL